MNAKIPVFVICVEAIIYLLSYNLHDCTFKCVNLINVDYRMAKSDVFLIYLNSFLFFKNI